MKRITRVLSFFTTFAMLLTCLVFNINAESDVYADFIQHLLNDNPEERSEVIVALQNELGSDETIDPENLFKKHRLSNNGLLSVEYKVSGNIASLIDTGYVYKYHHTNISNPYTTRSAYIIANNGNGWEWAGSSNELDVAKEKYPQLDFAFKEAVKRIISEYPELDIESVTYLIDFTTSLNLIYFTSGGTEYLVPYSTPTFQIPFRIGQIYEASDFVDRYDSMFTDNRKYPVNFVDHGIMWELNYGTKTLTVNGSGDMDNYNLSYYSPTTVWGNEIEALVVEDGVTSIGDYAFAFSEHLETATLPDTLTDIGYYAFFDCISLESIDIPQSVKHIDGEAFGPVDSEGVETTPLKELRFYGNAPETDWNILLKDRTVNIYYPADNPTWNSVISGEFDGDVNWIAWDAPAMKVENKFDDIIAGAWYIPGIQYVYENGIMTGMGETKFSPSTNLTREQLMQVFFNLSSPKISDYLGNTGFNDVPADRWYSPAIKWAKAEGITSGVKENVFGLGQNVTREQLATFIMNYVEYSGGDITSEASLDRFTDADKVSDWAVAGMQFCVENSIINGKTETTLDPRGYATRAELAQMLSVFLEAGFVYRVDFDSDGADACEMKFRYIAPNAEIGYLPFAEKEGLKFDGWWLNGERITSSTVLNLTAHTTLTAKWAYGNRVFFVTDGGECNEEYRYVAQGEPLGELPVPTRDGYSFEGWLFELEDESYIVSADTVIEVDVDYTLTAQWKAAE